MNHGVGVIKAAKWLCKAVTPLYILTRCIGKLQLVYIFANQESWGTDVLIAVILRDV
jgi:hypothetical protein